MTNYNYHQLLKYVYFEGYADSYEEAESLLEELTDEEFSQLYSLYESSGMTPGNRKTWERLVAQHGDQPFTNPKKSKTKSASKREEPTPQQSSPKPKKRRLDYEVRENYEMILSYLLDEGYADNEKSALAIMNSMSEEWMESIIEQSNTLVTPEQRRADEERVRGIPRTRMTPVPAPQTPRSPSAQTKQRYYDPRTGNVIYVQPRGSASGSSRMPL